MEEELWHSPRCPTWIVLDTPVHDGEECGMFSDSGIIDMTKNMCADTIVPLKSYAIHQAGFPGLFNNF